MVFVHAMPGMNPGGSGPSGGAQRTTFRPPWVKDGPPPIPMPTAPWTLARTRDGGGGAANPEQPTNKLHGIKLKPTEVNAPSKPAEPEAAVPVRRQSKITIIPSRPSADPKENGHPVVTSVSTAPRQRPEVADSRFKVPEVKLKAAPQAREVNIKVAAQEVPPAAVVRPTGRPMEVKTTSTKVVRQKTEDAEAAPPQPLSKPPPPPMMPAAPPPPPPPPPRPGMAERQAISAVMTDRLDALRSRPRKRPDWGTMMKEIEGGRKLNKVVCNDRSAPLLSNVKVKEQFMFESEKPNVHNILLKQIQGGVNLKRVQTNDRSKPMIAGLRKFRRQMTIEEQINKASAEDEEAAPGEPDELDDIDKVRDDLQSTKQMLQLELRNKEAVERENKRLLARLLNMELEMEKEKSTDRGTAPNKTTEDDKQAEKMKKDLEGAQREAEKLENQYHEVAGQLDLTKGELEDAVRKNQMLERKLAAMAKGEQPLTKQPSSKRIAAAPADAPTAAGKPDDSESEYEEYTETESSSAEEEEDAQQAQERRTVRELKLLSNKLRSFRDKEELARRERRALRNQLRNQQKALKQERHKYKLLQKEVDKMAKLMKDDEDEEEEEEQEEEEEESEESDSETDESEEEGSEGDLPEDAPTEKRRQNMTDRAKRHENCLAALKKGNYLLKANIDRFKDDHSKQKEMSLTLQEDLNSVLAELG